LRSLSIFILHYTSFFFFHFTECVNDMLVVLFIKSVKGKDKGGS
jgi:hypothetical protein